MSYETAEEMVADQQDEEQDQSQKSFRLAIVESINDSGLPILRFYGEDDPSDKIYKMIKGYSPFLGDTVLMAAMAESYIIIGKVSSDLVDVVDYITEEQVEAIITDKINSLDDKFATKTHYHSSLGRVGSNSFVGIAFGNAGYFYTNDSDWGLGASNYPWRNGYFKEFIAVDGKRLLTDRIYAGSSYSSNYLVMESATLLRPSTNGSLNLGSSSYKLNTIYASTGTINTSDRKQKKNIKKLQKKYSKFLMSLQAKVFRLKNGESGRYHAGFIAQDVELAMKECGIDSSEFAGFIKSPIFKKNKDGSVDETSEVVGYDYGLRYEEFLPLIVDKVQENTREIQEIYIMLKASIKENKELKKRIGVLERSKNE